MKTLLLFVFISYIFDIIITISVIYLCIRLFSVKARLNEKISEARETLAENNREIHEHDKDILYLKKLFNK